MNANGKRKSKLSIRVTLPVTRMGAAANSLGADRVWQAGYLLGYLFNAFGRNRKERRIGKREASN